MECPIASEAGDSLCSSLRESQWWEDTDKESGHEDDFEDFGEDKNIEKDVSAGMAGDEDATMMTIQKRDDEHEESQKTQEYSVGTSELRQDVCHERNDANGSLSPERQTPARVYSNDIDEAPIKVVDDKSQNKDRIIDINECHECLERGSLREGDSNTCPWLEVTNGHHSEQAGKMKTLSHLSTLGDIRADLDESIKHLSLKTNILEENEGGELETFEQESKKNNSPDIELLVCKRNTDSVIVEDLEHSKDSFNVSKQNTAQMEKSVDTSRSLLKPCQTLEPRSKNPVEIVSDNIEILIERSSNMDKKEKDAESQLPQEDCCEKETHQVDKLVDHNKHPFKRPFIAKMGSFVIKSNFSFEQTFAACASQSLSKPFSGINDRIGKVSVPKAPPRSQNRFKVVETKPIKSNVTPHNPKLPKGEEYSSSQWFNVKPKYLRSSGLHSKRVEALLLKYLGPESYKSKRTSQSSPESIHSSP